MIGRALSIVPAWAWIAAAAALIAGGVGWHYSEVRAARQEGAAAGAARVQALWDAAKAQAQAAAASAAAEYRATEQRRADAARKEIDDAHTRLSAAVADAGRAAAAADGLRNAARATARRCAAAGNPAPAASSPAAPNPGDVLADVLGLVEQAGRDMAQEADRRGIAGAACERLYDSLQR